MQVTDWHVDFNYLEGATKHCNDEICCQAQSGVAVTSNDKARKYGEFTCDIPYITA